MPKKPEIYFEVKDYFGKKIRTTKAYWNKIILIKHPIMKGKEKEVKETLGDPVLVKRSEKDEDIYLYYKSLEKYKVCVVARHENAHGFIITTYIARSIAQGEIIWEK